MRLFRWGLPLYAVLFLPTPDARAGLYYSGEEIAPLPSQWRGFLIDQRLLRTLGFKPATGVPSNPLRQREPRGSQDLDDLLGVRFVNDKGEYEPGRLGAAQRKKLRADAVASVQQVALWLPADGRLLWLLGELAASHGDVRTAAAIMDG